MHAWSLNWILSWYTLGTSRYVHVWYGVDLTSINCNKTHALVSSTRPRAFVSLASSWLWSSWIRLRQVPLDADATFLAEALQVLILGVLSLAGSCFDLELCVCVYMYTGVHLCGYHLYQTQVRSQLCW